MGTYEIWTNDYCSMNIVNGYVDYSGNLRITGLTDNNTRYNGKLVDDIIQIG